jgi:hypothetical protein
MRLDHGSGETWQYLPAVGFRSTALKASSFFSLFQLRTCSKNFGGKFPPSATACNTSHTSMRPGTSDRPGDTPMGRPPRRAAIEIGVPKSSAWNASVNSVRGPRTVFLFCCIRSQQVLYRGVKGRRGTLERRPFCCIFRVRHELDSHRSRLIGESWFDLVGKCARRVSNR